jgi:ATP-dependent DNA helicase UvrD/PcrA
MSTLIFEAYSTNPEGRVERLSLYSAETFIKGSAILCRNTAPLVGFCYALLQRDVPCKILGRDIGAQLATLVKKLRAINLDDFLDKLATWQARETERAHKEDRSPEHYNDQAECLRFFVNSLDEDSRTVDSLLAKIELMFTDEANGESKSRVTLSTIHKAKGLEFPVVFLLDWGLLPSRYAEQEWQQRQERNLQYVAITRSMDKLYYINSEHWKD